MFELAARDNVPPVTVGVPPRVSTICLAVAFQATVLEANVATMPLADPRSVRPRSTVPKLNVQPVAVGTSSVVEVAVLVSLMLAVVDFDDVVDGQVEQRLDGCSSLLNVIVKVSPASALRRVPEIAQRYQAAIRARL